MGRVPMQTPSWRQLLENIKVLNQVVVAFSGGVDSSLLAFAARQALGDRVVAITVQTPYIPQWEIKEARFFAARYHIAHEIIELAIPADIAENPPNRCYLCKKELLAAIQRRARELGIDTIIEGSNTDDLSDYRPGMRAVKELGVISPLLATGMDKETIRTLSQQAGLPSWNKPASACLLSRLPYHTKITPVELDRIALAEMVLRELEIWGGRVRSHGDIARIEVPVEAFATLLGAELRLQLVKKIKNCGYLYVTLDMEGYQMGSLNQSLMENHE